MDASITKLFAYLRCELEILLLINDHHKVLQSNGNFKFSHRVAILQVGLDDFPRTTGINCEFPFPWLKWLLGSVDSMTS